VCTAKAAKPAKEPPIMATVSDPAPRCWNCHQDDLLTLSQGADATVFCMNPQCGALVAKPDLPPLPADAWGCSWCERRTATTRLPSAGGPAYFCDVCTAGRSAFRLRQLERQAAALGARVVPTNAPLAPEPDDPPPAPATTAGRRGRRARTPLEVTARETLYRNLILRFTDEMERPPDATELADLSGYNRKTLQRCLQRRGQTYHQFRDDTLRDTGKGHLFDGN